MKCKSQDQRDAEAAKLESELRGVGIPEADLQPVFDLLNEFRRGHGFSGVVKLPQFNLAVVVKLSVSAHVHSDMRITALHPKPGLKPL